MAEIVLRKGSRKVFQMSLLDPEISIGRDNSNQIVIDSPDVSRRHARLRRGDGSYVLEDLGSANGSYVAGKRVRSHVLQDGDEVTLGDHVLTYLAPRQGEERAAAAEEERIKDQTVVFDLSEADLQQVLLGDQEDSQVSGRAPAERLKALFEISQTIEGARDFSGVLAAILDKAIAIMNAERGFIMLEDADTKELRVHVARDRQGDITGVERESVSRSLMRRVVETGKPVLVLDAQTSGDWSTQSVLAHSIHSALCAPLASRDQVTGVIYVDHRSSPAAFGNDDVAFFTTFALQAKAAIDNSRAYWDLVESLFRASDDFILVVGTDGTIAQVNRSGCSMLRMTEEQVTAQRLVDLAIPQDRDKAEQLLADTLRDGVASGREIGLRPSEGRTLPLNISSFTMRDRRGEATGVCLIGRDLSVNKFLINQLERRNKFIRKTFGRYLSDEIVDSILESPEGMDLGGQKRKVTILMSDLRGFTSLSGRIAPEQVVTMLNNYLGPMAEIILGYHGTIDEFIGDAVLAIFGAPESRPDDAVRAAACAVAMQLAMDDVNKRNAAAGLPPIDMGIGLNTGEVVVGNIGSHKRAKYGVVGSVVNMTSRIESFTIGGQILMSEATLQDAGDVLEVGRMLSVKTKGKKEPVTVYELRGVRGEHNLLIPEKREVFKPLAQPVAVRFQVLEGKAVGDTVHEAEMIRLGERGAVLRSAVQPEPLDNLSLVLCRPDGAALEADTYAKVTEREPDQDEFAIRFTSVPPEADALLRELRG